ncbi:MAG: hypothetical protein R3C30_17050 [Hyphomonadaceae bacterium]
MAAAFISPAGRGWSGSSAINGMIYIRGHARYDLMAPDGPHRLGLYPPMCSLASNAPQHHERRR